MAHAEKRIERLAPELDQIISRAEPIRELAEGFGGALGPAEGLLWWTPVVVKTPAGHKTAA